MQRSNEAAVEKRSAEFLELLKKCSLIKTVQDTAQKQGEQIHRLNGQVANLQEELRLLKSKLDPSVEQSVKKPS